MLNQAMEAEFKPDYTPSEILSMGSFGGGYFRPIWSSVCGEHLQSDYMQFEWADEFQAHLHLILSDPTSFELTNLIPYFLQLILFSSAKKHYNQLKC